MIEEEFGVSTKRTLRKRYKQNSEDINMLEVDYMCLITLGVDLNETKLNNILSKDKYFVIVSREIYESTTFLKNNPRVLSSSKLSKNSILELIKKM